MLAWQNEKKIWEYDILNGNTYGTFKEQYTAELSA